MGQKIETVWVQHRSVIVNGKTMLKKTKGESRRVIARYDGGEIMDHCGENWKVRPSKNGKTTWETVA